MTIQWIIVGICVAACIYMAVRTYSKKNVNKCDGCAVRDCCNSPRKK